MLRGSAGVRPGRQGAGARVSRNTFKKRPVSIHDKEEIAGLLDRCTIGHKPDALHAKRDLTLAHAEEATDVDQHRIHATVAGQDNIVDRAMSFQPYWTPAYSSASIEASAA